MIMTGVDESADVVDGVGGVGGAVGDAVGTVAADVMVGTAMSVQFESTAAAFVLNLEVKPLPEVDAMRIMRLPPRLDAAALSVKPVYT